MVLSSRTYYCSMHIVYSREYAYYSRSIIIKSMLYNKIYALVVCIYVYILWMHFIYYERS